MIRSATLPVVDGAFAAGAGEEAAGAAAGAPAAVGAAGAVVGLLAGADVAAGAPIGPLGAQEASSDRPASPPVRRRKWRRFTARRSARCDLMILLSVRHKPGRRGCRS